MFLLRSLILRPMGADLLRTVLTVLGVAVGVAAVLGIRQANQASLDGFAAALEATSGRASLEIVCPPLGVDETLLRELAWLREYGVHSPVVSADVLAVTDQGEEEMLHVLGIDALRDPALRDYPVEGFGTQASGMQLLELFEAPDQLLVTEGFAAPHDLEVGSTVGLTIGDREHPFRIAGVIRSAREGQVGLRGSFGIMDIAVAQALLEGQGRVDRLDLRLHEGSDVAKVEAEVRERLPVGLTVQRPARRGEAVEKMLAAFHFNLTMLSTIALVVGVFLIYNTLSVAVMTRRAEIGMLRTLGVERRTVLMLFLAEALLLGLAGAAVGVPVGQLLARLSVGLTATTVNTLYVAQAAQVPQLDGSDGVLALLVALPLSLLAAARPALEAMRVSPVAAVTGQDRTAARQGQLKGSHLLGALICLLLGFWACAQPAVGGLPLWGYAAAGLAVVGVGLVSGPVLILTARLLRTPLGRGFGIVGRLAASQIQASTQRLTVSVAALAVSLALTTAIAVMVSSFRDTVTLWVDQSMGADLYLRPATPPRGAFAPSFRSETVEALKAHPEVEVVDGYRALDLPHEGRLVKLGSGDYRLQLERGGIQLKTPGDPRSILAAALERGEVLVSESFAMRFNKVEGDRITLQTPRGPVPFRIAAQFYDYSNDRGTITLDRRQFVEHFGETPPTHIALYLREGADAETVKRDLAALLGEARVVAFTNQGLREEVLRIFDSTFAITWALEGIAILAAMAGIAATLLTLILERRREVDLLRCAGAEVGQVRRTVLLESALLGGVSQALGLGVGLLLSLVLIRVINPQSFGWSIQFHLPMGFLIASSLLTVVASAVAGYLPARRATRGAASPRLVTAFALLAGLGLPATGQGAEEEWKAAQPGYSIALPRDHGSHPEYKIEWWYYTGNLASGEREFGYQLTFFRIGAVARPELDSRWALRDVWMAHLAVTDVESGRYWHADRLNRAGPGLAGAAPDTLDVWNEDWSTRLTPDGGMSLTAGDPEFGLQLELAPSPLPMVLHGKDGFSQKGSTPGNASHYYSLVQMPTKGWITLGEDRFEVTGRSWMDHEFGTSFLEPGQQGWDWFSAQFDDGSALMLFQLRHEDGVERTRFSGTWVSSDGEVTPLQQGDFALQPVRTWISPETQAAYPVDWSIRIPRLEVDLEVKALMEAQEMRASSTPGLQYWEGAVRYDGERNGNPLRGRGYLEMTGYVGQSMGTWFQVE